jgi:hypothetical protein
MIPIFICKLELLVKWACSISFSLWDYVSWASTEIIYCAILHRARSKWLDRFKSRIFVYNRHFDSSMFAKIWSSTFGSHLQGLITAWSRILKERKLLFIDINCFRSMCKTDCHSGSKLILILNRRYFTAPGPGTFSFLKW